MAAMQHRYNVIILFTLILIIVCMVKLPITFSSRAQQEAKQPTKQLAHPADAIICRQPLGALYSPTATTFRVFAPTASILKLHLYETPVGGQAQIIEMKK